jgi:hypothetical protein
VVNEEIEKDQDRFNGLWWFKSAAANLKSIHR